jgi:hypothetical protein
MYFTRRSSRTLLVCGLMAVCPTLSVSTPASTSKSASPCAQLRQWASEYRGPVTLEALSSLDRAQRRAIFGLATPETRASLFRAHLMEVATRSDLSSTQLALIREGMTFATAAFYSRPRDPKLTEAFHQFWRRAASEFAAPSHRAVWFDLGRSSPATTQVPYCSCNTTQFPHWGCQHGTICQSAACEPVLESCGPFLAHDCDGECAPSS